MNILKHTFILANILITSSIYSQSKSITQEVVTSKLSEYYKLERENIHLHLNKNNYLTTESIWFKGYIIEKKSKLPFSTSSNIYVSLLDNNGTIIETKLHFSENSTFEGLIKLNPSIKTGKYYIHTYTNFMNNFSEDESSLFEINIINPIEKKIIENKKINLENIEMSFYPESGVFLEGIINIIGVKISDCNGNGISLKDIEIINSKEKSITFFSTDANGYGKISLNPEKNETYKAIIKTKELNIEKILPNHQSQGVVLSVNNFAMKDKTLISLKTNPNTKQESYSIVINQNENVSLSTFSFKEDEYQKNISLGNDQFLEGLNTVTITNSNGKKIGERIIYNPPKNLDKLEIVSHYIKNDSIIVTAKSPILSGSLSISVLPDHENHNIEKSIYNSLIFDNQINNSIKNINYYINNFSKSKHFELDNVLITQTNKYDLEKTLTNEDPIKKFEFDNGLTIKGTINDFIYNEKSENFITMNSLLYGINEQVKVNNKNEFIFENIVAIDSTSIYFTLLNSKGEEKLLNMFSTITNNNRKFYKKINIKSSNCFDNLIEVNDFIFPKIKNAYILEEVSIENKKKPEKFSDKPNINNSYSRGFKINDELVGTFRDVLSFIRAHGYNVSEVGAEVYISKNSRNSFSENNSPTVFYDGFPIESNNFLKDMRLDEIDEIYINKSGFGGGIDASNGVIKIFSKPITSKAGKAKLKAKMFTVKDGFQPYKSFTNPNYSNYHDDSFKKFGTIHWIPNINTDVNGNFKFSIPNLYQKTIKIVIEGISSDGKLLSEIKTISIP